MGSSGGTTLVMMRMQSRSSFDFFKSRSMPFVQTYHDAAMAKMWLSNLHCKCADECLQLFGGWGYMWEYPISRAFADCRIVKIAGGSIEVMKQIIARSILPKQEKRGAARHNAAA